MTRSNFPSLTQRGSAFLSALVVTAVVFLATYTAFQRFGDTKDSFRMARVRNLMGITEQQLRARALLPEAYINCASPSTCRVSDAFFADLIVRPVSGASCPAGKINCGVRLQLLPFDTGNQTFNAEIRYEGTEVKPKPLKLSLKVPHEVLQADVFQCGLIDPEKPVFTGFDASGAPICKGFNVCGPGQFIHQIIPSQRKVVCKSLPGSVSCSPQNLISSFHWQGNSLSHACAGLPDPPYELDPTVSKLPECVPGKPCCTSTDLQAAKASMMKNVDVPVNTMATSCIDGIAPTMEANLPTSTILTMRFMNTCAKRWCQQQSYYTGRGIELGAGEISVECRMKTPPSTTNPACISFLEATPPINTTPMISEMEIAQACVAGTGQDPSSVLPIPGNDNSYVSFFTTCGNRYCTSKGFGSGRVVEYLNNQAAVECYNPKADPTNEDAMKSLTATPLAIASACTDPSAPDPAMSMPEANLYRFLNTCGNRFCKASGFDSGNVVEHNPSEAVVNCYKGGK